MYRSLRRAYDYLNFTVNTDFKTINAIGMTVTACQSWNYMETLFLQQNSLSYRFFYNKAVVKVLERCSIFKLLKQKNVTDNKIVRANLEQKI